MYLGCAKAAQGRTSRCILHGGGTRCTEEGCGRTGVGKTNKCIAHGGGKRCLEEGCTNAVHPRLKGPYCSTHKQMTFVDQILL